MDNSYNTLSFDPSKNKSISTVKNDNLKISKFSMFCSETLENTENIYRLAKSAKFVNIYIASEQATTFEPKLAEKW